MNELIYLCSVRKTKNHSYQFTGRPGPVWLVLPVPVPVTKNLTASISVVNYKLFEK